MSENLWKLLIQQKIIVWRSSTATLDTLIKPPKAYAVMYKIVQICALATERFCICDLFWNLKSIYSNLLVRSMRRIILTSDWHLIVVFSNTLLCSPTNIIFNQIKSTFRFKNEYQHKRTLHYKAGKIEHGNNSDCSAWASRMLC